MHRVGTRRVWSVKQLTASLLLKSLAERTLTVRAPSARWDCITGTNHEQGRQLILQMLISAPRVSLDPPTELPNLQFAPNRTQV